MADLPKDSEHDDAARVRLVLSRELETISQYEAMAARSEREEVRAFFLHLAAEEKEHVAEAVSMLRMLDQDQNAHFQKDVAGHLVSLGASKATGPVPSPSTPQTSASSLDLDLRLPHHPEKVVHALPYAPSPHAGTFTVGPLKSRR